MGYCGNRALCNVYRHSLLTQMQFNLMDTVLPSRRCLALQTQFPLTDAGPTPTGARAAPTVTKIAIKGATMLSNLKDLNIISMYMVDIAKKTLKKGYIRAAKTEFASGRMGRARRVKLLVIRTRHVAFIMSM